MVWFIWRGYGFLVPIVGLAVGGGIVLSLQHLIPEANVYYLQALGLIIAAVALWFIGQKLYSAPNRIFIDQATGEELVIKPTHTFYWIKVHHWSFVFAAFALFLLGKG